MLCPPPGAHPNPGIEPVSLTVQLYSLPLNHCGRPRLQFSSVQLLSRVPFFAGVGRRQREPLRLQGGEQKAALQPLVTTSPWQGACPSCLYTEVVERTFPFSLEMVDYFCSQGEILRKPAVILLAQSQKDSLWNQLCIESLYSLKMISWK